MIEPTFDTARLDAYLRAALPGLDGPVEVEPVAGGQSNPTFFVSYPGRRLVLRKQPPGPLLPSAHRIDREHRVLVALAGSAVPVPEALLFCGDRSVVGTPFYVMARVDGRVWGDCALPGLEPAGRRAAYRATAGALAALHALDPAARGLGDYGRPGNFYARQVRRWGESWRAARTREDGNVERLLAWLPAHLPAEGRAAVVHGDYRVGNLMFAPDGPRVAAVLDWELSTLGDPLFDLAHSCIAWHARPDEYGGLLGLDLAALGIPSQAEHEDDYRAALVEAGADPGPRLSAFHMAFALFRWAMIFEGIAGRARAGNAASADAARVGALAAGFAERAAGLIG